MVTLLNIGVYIGQSLPVRECSSTKAPWRTLITTERKVQGLRPNCGNGKPPEDDLQQQIRKFVTKNPCPDEAFYFQIFYSGCPSTRLFASHFRLTYILGQLRWLSHAARCLDFELIRHLVFFHTAPHVVQANWMSAEDVGYHNQGRIGAATFWP